MRGIMSLFWNCICFNTKDTNRQEALFLVKVGPQLHLGLLQTGRHTHTARFTSS